MSTELDTLVQEVLASSKYAAVSPELVRAIAARELAAHRRVKEAIKETKNKLHQIGGSYLEPRMSYAAWLEELRGVAADPSAFRQSSLAIMRHHASTRERLPLLERFYSEIFGLLPPITSVLDLACGLNPLALPWMPLAAHARYMACDIYADMVDFIGEYLTLTSRPGRSWVCNLVQHVPAEPVDLAFAFKLLPVLEQIEKGAAQRLLDTLQATAIVVSFPAQSLGGRSKGMPVYYERMLRELVEERPWTITKLMYATELAFVITKPVPTP
jgi:16S rRNA (guanine(1405)-N(7))-methyltransferase